GGVAGPLLGFAVALPLTLIGLALSRPVATTDPMGITLPLTPAIFAILQIGAFGYVPSALSINPLAFAGWVVMLLTMLNLIPAGQLDGGHVARGLMSRERHFTLTRTLGFTLFFTGIFFPEFPFWVWGFLIILFFRGYHMGALDDVSRLSRRQKRLAAVALIVFLLCLPVPVG
ncbi:MAG: site-2 protease family protein, partial [Hadesarchaea archaeon]|nr:site-2 protease family protein [Hadesarchaea archaeon]